jgi:16S rRNA processing protein RimM
MRQEFLECGQIMRAHGINGAMVVNHFCDSYEVFSSLKYLYLKGGGGYLKYKAVKCAPYKTNVLITLEGIESPEDVTKLRLSYLYCDRDDILKDEDDYFIVDLIGLPVIDKESKEKYGVLKDVINQGAQDLYQIAREGKADAYVPAIPQFVNEIKLDEAIYITPIEGMLD